ncbi:type VII toxin-antitoxin system MntA family adenylyltransferase antitoxin [Pelovirga terrestris]|uniref:Nucleotidyltransferase domain-containing protein n=1 Tax=Pelovirga terrestris TaxID=2771352 RepID=A0A8J6QRF2_9BACT|nr:nucleotidyltransferase domain-containing protein [Pelovirga terrestris]MBD1400898.1 nucleotidyltransferase domain-containing protein [Pelovirga terrestris]
MLDPKKDQQTQEYVKCVTARISRVLATYPVIAAVYLLGSAAAGSMRDDSDIDIALLPADEQPISLQSRLEMAALLQAELHRVVDIGVITTKNLIYASEAIFKGRRIITVHKDYTEAMEARLLGCYLIFRQDRKVVEESYRAA